MDRLNNSGLYRGNWEIPNNKLSQASYFKRNVLDLSKIKALGNLKPNIDIPLGKNVVLKPDKACAVVLSCRPIRLSPIC